MLLKLNSTVIEWDVKFVFEKAIKLKANVAIETTFGRAMEVASAMAVAMAAT